MILYNACRARWNRSRESYLGIGVCVEAVWDAGVVGQVDIHHSIENHLQQTRSQTSLHHRKAPDMAVKCFAAATLLQSSTAPYLVGRSPPTQSLADAAWCDTTVSATHACGLLAMLLQWLNQVETVTFWSALGNSFAPDIAMFS